MNRKWNNDEIDFIKKNACIYSDDRLTVELGTHFNKAYSKGAVRKCRQRLKIKKTGYRGHFEIVEQSIPPTPPETPSPSPKLLEIY